MPGRRASDFDLETQLEVLSAYLERSESHRQIQRSILGLPAPARGGGFVAMQILHDYDIREDRKGILNRHALEEELQKAKGQYRSSLELMQHVRSFRGNVEKIVAARSGDYEIPPGPTEIAGVTRIRLAQKYLRSFVLASYEGCALCLVNRTDLLICSHIVPWAIDVKNRLNPSNAICFCVWHDRLFDRGYFSFDGQMNVVVSKQCPEHIAEEIAQLSFHAPSRFPPKEEFITYHRKSILQK